MKIKKRLNSKNAPKPSDGKKPKATKLQKKKAIEDKITQASNVIAKLEIDGIPTKQKETSSKKANLKEAPPVDFKPAANKKQLKKILNMDGLLVKHQEGTKWYNYQVDEIHDESKEKLSTSEIAAFLTEGKDLLAQDSALFQTKEKQQNGSEASWLYSVISKGTSSDKRTAMQLQMHKSPVHSLEYVEKLIASCQKQGTRDIIDVIPILEDLFVNHCLPENRKLLTFSKRPLTELNELSSGNVRSRRKILLLWAFEHELKILYQQFLQTMIDILKRPLDDVVKRALRTLANCLTARPEAENLLLSSIVNSFGHPNYKIGSYVVYLLEDISRKHPAMRIVMVEEVERLVFRKNVNERAHLYSVTFLSQMKFSKNDSDLASRLMSIYLSLFKTIVNKKITDSRLLPIILAGANRAFPYAKDIDKLLEDVKDIYYLAHNSNYRTALPALKLLFQFHKMNEYVTDRFYNALYRKLLDNCPPAACAQFLKLFFDTMKDDPSAQRVRALVKRLLQVAVNASSEFAASILILVSRLKKERQGETLVILSKEADPSARVVSQMEDDDDEERYVDLDAEGNEIKLENSKSEDIKEEPSNESDEKKKMMNKINALSTGGWVHRQGLNHKGSKTPYDAGARNPLFVDASQFADNELLLLSNHFHPSVSVFAKCLLEGGEINYGGDSMNDFTLMSFLDRFAFRNPKDVAKSNKRVVRKSAHDPWGVRKLAIDSKEYIQKKRDEIPADEKFLHRYATTLLTEKKEKKAKTEEDDWEYADSVNSDEFDAIMERFEPGELNEEFDIDYSKEFSSEKNKRKKNDDVDMDEDDIDNDEDADDDDMENDDDDAEDDDDDNEDDEDEDDDDDIEDDDDEDDAEINTNSNGKMFGDDDISSDEEVGENDYELAGDKFAEMLEDLEDDEDEKKNKKKKGGKRGKRSFGGGSGAKRFKRR